MNLLKIILLIFCFVIVLFQLIIPGFYLNYVKKMEDDKCECSRNFARHFLTFYSIYTYTSLLIVIILLFFISPKDLIKITSNKFQMFLKTGFSFLIAYFLYRYSTDVILEACKCAQTWETEVMKYHSYLQFILVFISCINIIIILSK